MSWEGGGAFVGIREALESSAETVIALASGQPALIRSERAAYLAGWPDQAGAKRVFEVLNDLLGLELNLMSLPAGLRCRETEKTRVWVNYSNQTRITPSGNSLEPAGLSFEALETDL